MNRAGPVSVLVLLAIVAAAPYAAAQAPTTNGEKDEAAADAAKRIDAETKAEIARLEAEYKEKAAALKKAHDEKKAALYKEKPSVFERSKDEAALNKQYQTDLAALQKELSDGKAEAYRKQRLARAALFSPNQAVMTPTEPAPGEPAAPKAPDAPAKPPSAPNPPAGIDTDIETGAKDIVKEREGLTLPGGDDPEDQQGEQQEAAPQDPDSFAPVSVRTRLLTVTGTGALPEPEEAPPFTPVVIRTGVLTVTGTGALPEPEEAPPFTPVAVRTAPLTVTGTGALNESQ